jgi:ATP-dependent Clp protease ATP-binding subunit ClpA
MRLRLPIRTRQFFAATIEEYADRFDTDARQALTVAEEEASRLGHGYVGTEHLLLGLLRERESIAAGVLESLDANERRVRAALAHIKYGAAAPEPLVMRSHRPGRADPAARHLEHAQRTIAWSADVAQRSGNLARAERLRRLADELQALINEGQQALDDDDQASGEEA